MSKNWIKEYILLAFRIHRITEAIYKSPFVEAYYGPPEWRSLAEAEPEIEAADLIRQAMMLADALALQGFTPQRTLYQGKHIKAMETLCRKLSGETFSLEEEAKYCLDICPAWTPETQFEQAHALYEKILPGNGSIVERLQAYRTALAFPINETKALTNIIEKAFTEARDRTSAVLELPQAETIAIQYFPEKEYDAAARYQGNYRTNIEMNIKATATYISRLFDHKICHEGYPGHHSEYVLKEQYLVHEQDYLEQTIILTLCPQCVITEGIAMNAHEMIFSPGEAETWIVEHVYRYLQKEVDPAILLQLRHASEMLSAVWDNAAMMLGEGQPEHEVEQYVIKYMPVTKDGASQMIAHLQQPIWGRYNLTYSSGQKLVQRWLQEPDRMAKFRRILTEQFVPSQLEENN